MNLSCKNNEAFEYLYENYSAVIYGYFLNKIPDEEIASGLLEDTFTRIWEDLVPSEIDLREMNIQIFKIANAILSSKTFNGENFPIAI